MSNAVTSSTSASATATDYAALGGTTRTTTKTLGQNDFLKLLVTQLSSQDPLNPTKDTDFIAQMAQFSSLEQAKSMSNDLSSLKTEQQIQQASDLLGRTVELTEDGKSVSGEVTAVKIVSGTPKIEVNGTLYELSKVTSVKTTPTKAQLV